MELLEGEDLDAVLQRRGPLPPPEVIMLLQQVALGIDRVHSVDVVHRDLKPANVFLTARDDGSPCVKLLDFGVAKRVVRAPDRAPTTRIIGTPAYMSPEQLGGDGNVGPPADVYALGHIAFALLTGKAYWSPEEEDGGIWLLMSKMARGLPEPATVRSLAFGTPLPAQFDAWFTRATALVPEGRFASASALVESLSSVLSGAPHSLEPAAEPPAARAALASASPAAFSVSSGLSPPPERPRRVPLVLLALAGALITGAIVARQFSAWATDASRSSGASQPGPPPSSAAATTAPTAATMAGTPSMPATEPDAAPGTPTASTTPAASPKATRPSRRATTDVATTPPRTHPTTVPVDDSRAAPRKDPRAPRSYDPADRP
jgi:serine/threonine-protein kinase